MHGVSKNSLDAVSDRDFVGMYAHKVYDLFFLLANISVFNCLCYQLSKYPLTSTEQTDRLASSADITTDLQLCLAELLKDKRNFLNMERPEHHSTDGLKKSRI